MFTWVWGGRGGVGGVGGRMVVWLKVSNARDPPTVSLEVE